MRISRKSTLATRSSRSISWSARLPFLLDDSHRGIRFDLNKAPTARNPELWTAGGDEVDAAACSTSGMSTFTFTMVMDGAEG